MTLVLSSTGHAGMECVMTNLLEKGDVVLIANHGIWGERAMDMARRQGKFFLLGFVIFYSPEVFRCISREGKVLIKWKNIISPRWPIIGHT